jgi:hypothetical protein
VLEALTYLRSQALRRLHILVTSRDEVDIRESLHPSSFEDITMKNEEVDEDIAAFISGHLEQSPALRKWSAHHSRIEEALTARAAGS